MPENAMPKAVFESVVPREGSDRPFVEKKVGTEPSGLCKRLERDFRKRGKYAIKFECREK
ncbi:MAG: hypothetical protein AAFN12_02275 [Cyanobacteria bacterium J06560_2]